MNCNTTHYRANSSSVPGDPTAQAPTRRWLAASSFVDNTVRAFTEEGAPLGSVRVGTHPMGMAYSAKRNELYVACEASGQIHIISLPRLERIAVVEIGDVYPNGLALSRDEERLWTANFFGSSVSEIDLNTRQVRQTIAVKALGEAVAFCPDQSLVVAMRKKIGWLDPANGVLAQTAESSDYGASFFTGADGKLAVIDTARWFCRPLDPATKTVGAPMPMPFPSRTIIHDAKTHAFWAGDCDGQAIVRIDEATGQRQKVATVAFPFGLVLVEP